MKHGAKGRWDRSLRHRDPVHGRQPTVTYHLPGPVLTLIHDKPQRVLMSVIGDFTVPAGAFALEHALAAAPEMVVEADRVASHSTMGVLPFLWTTGGDDDAFRAALKADPTVDSFTVADELGREVLYRVQWSEDVRDLIDRMVDHHAAISHAKACEGVWTLRLRFADESMVSDFQAFFREHDLAFEVNSLGQPSEPRQGEVGLTPEQRTALETAVRSGYFAIPREISAAELGERLGISGNAASERVRRGCATLIESGLLIDGRDGRP